MLIACVDVDYRGSVAVAAGVWFRGWSATEAETEAVATFRDVAGRLTRDVGGGPRLKMATSQN